MNYQSARTGNLLKRLPSMFYWRGRYFYGLVDVAANALYDDPEDSFAAHVGIQASIDQGLIVASE